MVFGFLSSAFFELEIELSEREDLWCTRNPLMNTYANLFPLCLTNWLFQESSVLRRPCQFCRLYCNSIIGKMETTIVSVVIAMEPRLAEVRL
jgi:hypothetical protein